MKCNQLTETDDTDEDVHVTILHIDLSNDNELQVGHVITKVYTSVNQKISFVKCYYSVYAKILTLINKSILLWTKRHLPKIIYAKKLIPMPSL